MIELLVAIAITVLLIGVVYLVYGTTLNTIRTQVFRGDNLEPAAETLETLQHDMLCSLAPRGATHPPFVLIPAGDDEPEKFSLRLFTAVPGTGANDWRAYGIDEVEYALKTKDTPDRYALVRRRRPFRIATSMAGDASRLEQAAPAAQRAVTHPVLPGGIETAGTEEPGSPRAAFTSETLLHTLAGLDIQVYDGQGWTHAWGTGETAETLPQAARISLRLDVPSGPRTIASETLIPAGHKIKAPSKLEQSGGT